MIRVVPGAPIRYSYSRLLISFDLHSVQKTECNLVCVVISLKPTINYTE